MALSICKQKRGRQPDTSTVNKTVKTTKTILSRRDPTACRIRIIGVIRLQLNPIRSRDDGIKRSSLELLRLTQPEAETMTIT